MNLVKLLNRFLDQKLVIFELKLIISLYYLIHVNEKVISKQVSKLHA